MSNACIIVADGGLARFLGVEEVEAPRARLALVERKVLKNTTDPKALAASVTGRAHTETNTDRGSGPMASRRERHRGELDRRFGMEITREAGEFTKGWERGTVVLVAEPQLLGLVRESLRKVLHPGVELKELAKDYAHLAPTELLEHLALNRLVPAPRRAAQ